MMNMNTRSLSQGGGSVRLLIPTRPHVRTNYSLLLLIPRSALQLLEGVGASIIITASEDPK